MSTRSGPVVLKLFNRFFVTQWPSLRLSIIPIHSHYQDTCSRNHTQQNGYASNHEILHSTSCPVNRLLFECLRCRCISSNLKALTWVPAAHVIWRAYFHKGPRANPEPAEEVCVWVTVALAVAGFVFVIANQ